VFIHSQEPEEIEAVLQKVLHQPEIRDSLSNHPKLRKMSKPFGACKVSRGASMRVFKGYPPTLESTLDCLGGLNKRVLIPVSSLSEPSSEGGFWLISKGESASEGFSGEISTIRSSVGGDVKWVKASSNSDYFSGALRALLTRPGTFGLLPRFLGLGRSWVCLCFLVRRCRCR
jgi:hypothetical protein